MADNPYLHRTVLLEEAVAMLRPHARGIYLDGTLGGGGHTRRILQASAPGGKVIALDQDAAAITAAQEWQPGFGERLTVVRTNFRFARDVLDRLGISEVDGILCDLGVSSPQLDEGERGFSYQQDAPLDMRMDRETDVTAATLLAELSEAELTAVFREYGEEKWAARIASFIARERIKAPLETTGQLVDLVKAAIPAAARREGPHPAKRIFQALRIAVNDELGALKAFVEMAPSLLKPGGRIAAITFHSLEDRIVKQTFAELARDCVCPPRTPLCVCGHRASMKLVTRKPLTPSEAEVGENPRARSAKLRIAERVNVLAGI